MLVNGLPSEHITADDRGLAYGDGLFETIRVHRHAPLFAEEHLARLKHGAAVLDIPCDLEAIRAWLATALASSPPDCVLKLVLTRGSGGRGYRPPAAVRPTCIISTHALPDLPETLFETGGTAFVCHQRLGYQPDLAGIKHLNRLEQVLASREFADHHEAFEGLMADHGGLLVEGTRSNVFVSLGGQWLTPALSRCGIRGILRQRLLEAFSGRLQETDLALEQLPHVDELFVANSVFGVVPLTGVDLGGTRLDLDVGPFAQAAMDLFREALDT